MSVSSLPPHSDSATHIRLSPTQTPRCHFQVLSLYASWHLQRATFFFCLGANPPALDVTIVCDHLHPVWTLTPHLGVFPSATVMWTSFVPCLGSDPLISSTPLWGCPLWLARALTPHNELPPVWTSFSLARALSFHCRSLWLLSFPWCGCLLFSALLNGFRD